MEIHGLGKFVPSGLSNVIGIEPMKQLIRMNNQYLKNIIAIPIIGLQKMALETVIVINKMVPESEQVKMTVKDYLLDALV